MSGSKINIVHELEKIILSTKNLKSTYTKDHPNKKYSLKIIINEIIYFLKSGVSWNMLRSEINPKTLYWHYTNWVKYDIFHRLLKRIKTIYMKKCTTDTGIYDVLIDTSVIPNRYGINKKGKNKFYKSKNVTKLSLMADTNGIPLSILFMKGNYHDNTTFEKHIKDAIIISSKRTVRIMADKAYSSYNNYKIIENNNMMHIIPPRKNMRIHKTYKYSKNIYRRRVKIENIFGIVKNYKRINIRYDKLLRNYQGFLYLAFLITSINFINKKL